MSNELRAGRELDAACARVLGWTAIDGDYTGLVPEVGTRRPIAYYSIDHECASWLEDEIDRRGLQDDYIRALLWIVAPDGGSVGAFWLLIRATPEQRARAFLEVVKGAADA